MFKLVADSGAEVGVVVGVGGGGDVFSTLVSVSETAIPCTSKRVSVEMYVKKQLKQYL